MRARKTTRIAAIFLACVMATPLWAVSPSGPQLPDPGSSPISKQDQIQIGQKALAQVYQQYPVLPDSNPLAQYVQHLGRKLEAVIPADVSWPYQFHVVQQKDVNAFAVPGGPLFVNVGTVLAADNEAQLAGVMAHEMAHVYMQHSAKEAGKASMTQGIAGVLGSIFGGGLGGSLARAGLGLGAGMLTMKYSRSAEAQADSVGAIIMYKAGYDPRALAQFFEKLAGEGGSGPQFLSDHPNPGNRQQAIDNEIAEWPRKSYVTSSPSFQQAKVEARNVKAYTGQEIAAHDKQGGNWNNQGPSGSTRTASQGANENGSSPRMGNVSYSAIRPSGQFQTLRQSMYSMSYPSNWQAQGDGQVGAQIAPAAGVSGESIAYGAIINGFQPSAQDDSVDAAVKELIGGIRQQNPDLRQSGSLKPVTVNGIQGRAVELTGTSPMGGRERDWLVAISPQPGTVLYTVFVSPEKDFNALKPTFEAMLRSWQVNGGR